MQVESLLILRINKWDQVSLLRWLGYKVSMLMNGSIHLMGYRESEPGIQASVVF